MGKFGSFEEIVSWQKARELNKQIYLITEADSFKKDFDLARQIRRCSVSISSNIAEGYERKTDKEFVHFLYIAKGAAAEVRSQLYLALDLNYISNELFINMITDITEISKLLSGLIKYLSKES
ncbi:four helix bundle protein [Flavobacterium sp.]|uniref:four helix bundle protein n=1 Tax=Flavobacterium sp. TaxID=239 RepID=UPI002621D678|nr:four helix bundle protein [Flavobacterium sp.]